jgi:hypothetical protein
LAIGFQASEEISKSLSAMKSILNGEAGGEAIKRIERYALARITSLTGVWCSSLSDQDSLGGITQLANEVYSQDVLKLLILNMPKFDFEVCSDLSPRSVEP